MNSLHEAPNCVFKKFDVLKSESMFAPSSSSRWVQAVGQCVITPGHENDPIPFLPLLLAAKPRRDLEGL
jgi:hypothetical protein